MEISFFPIFSILVAFKQFPASDTFLVPVARYRRQEQQSQNLQNYNKHRRQLYTRSSIYPCDGNGNEIPIRAQAQSGPTCALKFVATQKYRTVW